MYVCIHGIYNATRAFHKHKKKKKKRAHPDNATLALRRPPEHALVTVLHHDKAAVGRHNVVD